MIIFDYDFNSPPGKDGAYRVLDDNPLSQSLIGDEVMLVDEGLSRPGRVIGQYRILLVEPTGDFIDGR